MTLRALIKAGINDILIFAGFAAIFAVPVGYLWHQSSLPVWWLLLWLPLFVLLRLARARIRRFWVFLLLHVALVVGPVALYTATHAFPGLWLVTFLLIGGASAIFSLFYRFHPLPSPYVLMWPGCLVALVVGVIFADIGIPGLYELEMVCVVLLLAFTPLLRQMERLDLSVSTLETNKTSMDKPTLLRHNNGVVLTYTGLILAGVCSVPFLADGAAMRFLRFAGRQVLRFLRWFFSLFPSRGEEGASIADLSPITPPPDGGMELPEANITWMNTVMEILGNLFVAAVMILLLLGFVKFMLELYRRFNSGTAVGGDRVEVLGGLSRGDRATRKRRARPDFGSGEERRVRRLYYRTIRRQKGPLPSPSDTAGQILQTRRADIEGLDELTAAYNQARYGG